MERQAILISDIFKDDLIIKEIIWNNISIVLKKKENTLNAVPDVKNV
jgi:hypothetical protein